MTEKYLREPVPADLRCNVRCVRERSGWELSELARKIGTTTQTLRRLEAEKHAPSLPVALRISAILDVPVDHLWFVPSYDALRPCRTTTTVVIDLNVPDGSTPAEPPSDPHTELKVAPVEQLYWRHNATKLLALPEAERDAHLETLAPPERALIKAAMDDIIDVRAIAAEVGQVRASAARASRSRPELTKKKGRPG